MRANSGGRGGTKQIGLVLAGGTVGGRVEHAVVEIVRADGPSAAVQLGLVEQAWVGPGDLDGHIRQAVDDFSANLAPDHWLQIARVIIELVKQHRLSGVLVLHGTDTMSYTAAALSFLLAPLGVRVVLTGANEPPEQEGRTRLRTFTMPSCACFA
jgi:L-asparaginase/Glu-tRNA(Gln) amidotransferase subunit D